MSFIADRVRFDGLTFDDVLLVPAYSDVLPYQVDLSTRFSRNIALHVPFVSAAMDTVTIRVGSSVGQCLALMAEYHIGGVPVVDDLNKLVGIVTNRDLRFEQDMNKLVDDIMTSENLIIAWQSTNLEKASEILQRYKIEKLQRITALVDADVDAIVIDSAHGHTKAVIKLLRDVKAAFNTIDVVVGNIATAEAARMLVDAGADAVKVGIGPGSICTTRVIAGVGVPQLSAIYDVAQELTGTNVPLIADGGLRYSGDVVKALAAGANSVMMGGMLAGVEESPGETIIFNGRKFNSYRGMGSLEAMEKGSKDRYFQGDEIDARKLVPEGIAARVPFKGSLYEVVYQMVGGLRSGMGYCGASTIDDLHHAQFTRITSAGVAESHPHDVSITSEAPNYSRTD